MNRGNFSSFGFCPNIVTLAWGKLSPPPPYVKRAKSGKTRVRAPGDGGEAVLRKSGDLAVFFAYFLRAADMEKPYIHEFPLSNP